MPREKRKSARRPVSAAAFLYTSDGWPIGACQMIDISQNGAKLTVPVTDELPPELIISLSRDGKVRRACHLIWQKDDTVGVRFCKA